MLEPKLQCMEVAPQHFAAPKPFIHVLNCRPPHKRKPNYGNGSEHETDSETRNHTKKHVEMKGKQASNF